MKSHLSKRQKQKRLQEVARVKALEQQRLQENFDRLRTMSSGFVVEGDRLPTPGGSPVLTQKPYRRDTGHRNLPSVTVKVIDEIPRRVILSAEMAERERLAQIEIERKRKRVGVLYNKGGYQFITDGTDLTTLGKK